MSLPASPFPEKITIAQKYNPAMLVTTQEEADAYFELCVEHAMRLGKKSRAAAEELERKNLGYYAGYFDNATRARVERLFRCEHPFFGAIAKYGPPTPEQALAMGMKMGAEMKAKEAAELEPA
jgi:hypothetical protein